MNPQIASPWRDADARDVARAQKREAVLRTAAQAFCEKGVRATSLDEIAARLSVTKPTLYHYFAGKEAILAECVLMGLRLIEDALAAATLQRLSALGRLRAVLRRYAEIMTMDFGRCITRIAETELSTEGRTAFRAHKREIDQRIRGLMRDCVANGTIRDGDVTVMTATVAGALNWIPHWYDPAGPLSPGDIADQMVETLIAGLLVPAAPAPPPHAAKGE